MRAVVNGDGVLAQEKRPSTALPAVPLPTKPETMFEVPKGVAATPTSTRNPKKPPPLTAMSSSSVIGVMF